MTEERAPDTTDAPAAPDGSAPAAPAPSVAPVALTGRARLASDEMPLGRLSTLLMFAVFCTQAVFALRALFHDWLVHYGEHDAYTMANFRRWEAIGNEVHGAVWFHLGTAALALAVLVYAWRRRGGALVPVAVVLLLPLIALLGVSAGRVAAEPQTLRGWRVEGSLRFYAHEYFAQAVHAAGLVALAFFYAARRKAPDLTGVSKTFE